MRGVGLVAAVALGIPHQIAWMPLPVPFLHLGESSLLDYYFLAWRLLFKLAFGFFLGLYLLAASQLHGYCKGGRKQISYK